jgi:hypothetical protein
MSRRKAKSETPGQCPKCGVAAVRPILYGFPAPEALAAVARGEIVLGGCCIVEGAPIWHCTRCGAEGGRLVE